MDHHNQMKKDDSSLAEFTLAEMVEMNYLFEDVKEESISRDFCEELAETFSGSTARAGKSGILWEQVQEYFQEKLDAASVKVQSSLVPLKSPAIADQTIPSNGHASSEMSEAPTTAEQTTPADVHADSQVSKGGESNGLTELAFEGKSLRDNAWYDVASFLAYRYLCTGELEVRVRFSGFQKDHDEWLNVKRHVRERSIPLEASECHKVNVGDKVLCFQERVDYAVYCDARILEVQKRLHDEKGCRCIFLVRFDHDKTEGYLTSVLMAGENRFD